MLSDFGADGIRIEKKSKIFEKCILIAIKSWSKKHFFLLYWRDDDIEVFCASFE
jgi:hypothetical protein